MGADSEQLAADLQHLRDLLEADRVTEARRFVKELEQRWPEAERVQHYALVLAPPKVRSAPDLPARSSEQEIQWLQEHAREYPGCWLAVYEDRLIAAGPDRRVVVDQAEQALGEETYLLLLSARGALPRSEPELSRPGQISVEHRWAHGQAARCRSVSGGHADKERTPALVDTASEWCVLPPAVALHLGYTLDADGDRIFTLASGSSLASWSACRSCSLPTRASRRRWKPPGSSPRIGPGPMVIGWNGCLERIEIRLRPPRERLLLRRGVNPWMEKFHLLINLSEGFFRLPALAPVFESLRAVADVRQGSWESEEELLPQLQWANAVLMWSWPRLTDQLLDQCPNLRFCAHIDLSQATARTLLARGLPVSVSRSGFSPAVSEMALTLILSTLRRTPTHQARMGQGTERWVRRFPEEIDPDERQLTGRRVGLVGFGAIGQRLAELLAPFACDLRCPRPPRSRGGAGAARRPRRFAG